MPAEGEHDEETHALGHGGRDARALDAQAESEDQQRIQADVQDCARRDADHRQHRIALLTHLVVHREATHDERRPQQDIAEVILRVGEDGRSRTEESEDWFHPEKAQDGDQRAGEEGGEEPHGSHRRSLAGLAPAECARNEVAGPLPEIEGNGLDQGHIREYDAEGGHGLRVELPDEERVRQVVDAGHQHADDRRDRQRGDQPPDRRRRHPDELLLLQVLAHLWQSSLIGERGQVFPHDGEDAVAILFVVAGDD